MAEHEKVAPQSMNISMPDLINLMKIAIEEAKKPDADTLQKQLEDKALKVRQRDEMMKIVAESEAITNANQSACAHRKPNNEPSTGGQIINDGQVFLICTRCGKSHKFQPDNVLMAAIARGDVPVAGMPMP